MVGFTLVAGLLTIIPGLDTAIVMRSALRGGRRHGFAAAFGVSCGTLAWGAAAAVGIAAVLEVSTVAYTIIRIAGACYMVWLGARLLREAVRAGEGRPVTAGSVLVTFGIRLGLSSR